MIVAVTLAILKLCTASHFRLHDVNDDAGTAAVAHALKEGITNLSLQPLRWIFSARRMRIFVCLLIRADPNEKTLSNSIT